MTDIPWGEAKAACNRLIKRYAVLDELLAEEPEEENDEQVR